MRTISIGAVMTATRPAAAMAMLRVAKGYAASMSEGLAPVADKGKVVLEEGRANRADKSEEKKGVSVRVKIL